LNRKGLVGLAAFGIIVVIFALAVTMAAVMIKPAQSLGGTDVVFTTNITSLTAPNSQATITFYIVNNNATSSIYNLTIVLPAGFTFVKGTNFTNVSGMNFTNYSTYSTSTGGILNWKNLSNRDGVNSTNTGWFQINASIANYSGIYNFTLLTTDEVACRGNATEGGAEPSNVYNMAGGGIFVNMPVYLGKTQWSYCGPKGEGVTNMLGCVGPGINNTGGFFFFSGENVSVVANITDQYGKPLTNISVFFNFSMLGMGANSTDIASNLTRAVYDPTNGFYYAKGWINFDNASTWVGSLNNNLKPAYINILIDTCNTTGAHGSSRTCNGGLYTNNMNGSGFMAPGMGNASVVAMLVNMSSFGCPPTDDTMAQQMFSGGMVLPFNSTATVSVTGCNDYNRNGINATTGYVAASDAGTIAIYTRAYINTVSGYPPVIWNGSGYRIVSPNFGPVTTNISDVVRSRQNLSNITLTFDIPGTGRLTFNSNTSNGVDFTAPESMGGVMDFALKALVSRGRIGVNESDFNGLNSSGRARPNLTIAAELIIYNVTGAFGYSAARSPNIGYAAYSGMSAPTNIKPCNSTKCSSMVFDGENISFTVSSWSTYIIGDTNYTLQFANGTASLASVRQATITANTSTTGTKNATFYVNITNLGNATEFYYLNFSGIPECNRSVQGGSVTLGAKKTAGCLTYNLSDAIGDQDNGTIISLAANASRFLAFNFTANNTPGTYTFGLVAYHVDDTNVTQTSWNLNSTSDGVTWVVTVVPFALSISSPANATNISTLKPLMISYTTVNYTHLSAINWTINGTGGDFNQRTYVNATSPIWIGAANISNSTWQLMQNMTLWVNDTQGNINSTTLWFVADGDIPSASNLSHTIASGTNVNRFNRMNVTYYANFSNASVIFNVTVHDATTGIFSVQMNLSNSSGQANVSNMTRVINYSSGESTNYSIIFNPSAYRDGYYNMSLVIRDWADNLNGTIGTANLTGYITIDRQPPNVTWVKPTPATAFTVSMNRSFNVTVFDNLLSIYSVMFNMSNSSWSNTTMIQGNNTKGYGLNLNTSEFADGNYTMKVVANDTNNNVNDTAPTITFTIDNTAPTVTSWNYSLITKQVFILFSEVVDQASLDLSKLNITYNDGSQILFNSMNNDYSLNAATKHTSANNSVMIINLSSAMDVIMRDLLDEGEGQLNITAAAVRDLGRNTIAGDVNKTISTWGMYGIQRPETGLWTSNWNSFNLPRASLENRSSLNGNYSAQKILESIAGNYAGIYYYSSATWTSYVPGRVVNTFATFEDNTSSNNYQVYITSPCRLQII